MSENRPVWRRIAADVPRGAAKAGDVTYTDGVPHCQTDRILVLGLCKLTEGVAKCGKFGLLAYDDI